MHSSKVHLMKKCLWSSHQVWKIPHILNMFANSTKLSTASDKLHVLGMIHSRNSLSRTGFKQARVIRLSSFITRVTSQHIFLSMLMIYCSLVTTPHFSNFSLKHCPSVSLYKENNSIINQRKFLTWENDPLRCLPGDLSMVWHLFHFLPTI